MGPQALFVNEGDPSVSSLGTFDIIAGYLAEIAACQSDTTGMANAPIFPISRYGQRNASRAPNPSAANSTPLKGVSP